MNNQYVIHLNYSKTTEREYQEEQGYYFGSATKGMLHLVRCPNGDGLLLEDEELRHFVADKYIRYAE
jgi:hypothetical protein